MARQVISDAHLRSLRDDFKLEKFLTQNKDRRDVYFKGIDYAILSWKQLVDTPSDELVIDSLVIALNKDETFDAFIVDITTLEYRSAGNPWPDLTRAMAGTILQVYYRACDRDEWVPAT